MIDGELLDQSVVITGMGMVTPLGHNLEATWQAVLQGRGAGQLLEPELLGPAWRGVAASPDWRGCPIPRDWSQVSEPVLDDTVTAAGEALRQAQLSCVDPQRTGCIIGASKGGMHRVVPQMIQQGSHASGDGTDLLPFWWSWPNAPALHLANQLGIQGPVLAPAAACATGLVSLLRAVDLIRQGVCDVVLSGSCDASLHPALLASYRRLGVMARQGAPLTACRPFDRDRQGFLVGEGAAVLVLESRDHARCRGAMPLAEIAAGRVLSDGAGVTGLDETADGLTRAIQESLIASNLKADQIDMVSFHGTGTAQNDRSEATAWSRALGGRESAAHGCAFKGGIGHLMGGAGSVETALSVMALRDQLVPPTANLNQIDPDLQPLLLLELLRDSPVARSIRHVLKLSLGFGGPVAALVLRAV